MHNLLNYRKTDPKIRKIYPKTSNYNNLIYFPNFPRNKITPKIMQNLVSKIKSEKKIKESEN